MGLGKQTSGTWKFSVRQTALLITTVILGALFTIPLLQVVKAALDPAELVANLNGGAQQAAALDAKLAVTRTKMLMGTTDEAVQEKLHKEVESLKQQIALQELENKHLQEKMVLVQTILLVTNAKSAAVAPVPSVDTWHRIVELATKIFGCIGSLFSGAMFLFGWWRKRREARSAVDASALPQGPAS